MGFFESLFYTIWRGIAIGILISAPMGPVGILCIQRTLYKGRKTGLYTGIGAAISDLFYCILTGFGLSFIEVFLERNQNIIQLAGSAVLIAFAVYLFKKNPASSLKTPSGETTQISPHKNILGGFLFTFSNPLILFLIIGLFARFNFSIPEISFYYYIAGYIAIFIGALLWWQFVTFTVNKLRAHFNLRSMWLINRIIGVIILLFALVGIITGVTNLVNAETIHWNEGRGYLPFNNATPNGILLENTTDTLIYDYYSWKKPADGFQLDFRSKNINGHPAKKYSYTNSNGKTNYIKSPHWGFFLTCEQDTIAFTFKGNEQFTITEPVPCLDISTYNLSKDLNHKVSIMNNINPYNGDNLWSVLVERNSILLKGGDKGLNEILTFECPSKVTGFGFYSSWGGKVLLSDIDVEFSIPESNLESSFSSQTFDEIFYESNDPMEGYWTFFDRELEENLLKLGGSYTLACVAEKGCYNFFYLEGASVNSKGWEPGDIKAKLTPTPFQGIYDVEWYDATKSILNKEIKAQQGEGNTLEFQFPYQSSKFRLRKISKENQ